MSKYIVLQNGGDATGSDTFNGYVDQLLAQDQSNSDTTSVDQSSTPSPDEESDYIKSLRAYDEENSKPDYESIINEKFNTIEQKLNARLEGLVQTQNEIDPFGDEEDNIDYINSKYNTNNTSMPSPESTGSSAGFDGIFRNEGARTGQPTNLHSSALGRGQMIRGTREAMYKTMGIPEEQFGQAEQQFKTDPNFEQKVMSAYKNTIDARIPSNIQGKQRQYMIAKGWYTGNPFYPDNQVPGRSAGNKLTAGEYARRAVQ